MKADNCIDIDLSSIESLGVALDDYVDDLAKEFGISMVDTVVTIEKYAKHKCPVDTGKLRASITGEVKGFEEGAVGTNTEYAMPVEYGSRPHDIRPKDKKALAFEKGGEKVVVKRVKHPGNKAQPFMEPAFMVGGRVARKNFDQAVSETHEKVKAKLEES